VPEAVTIVDYFAHPFLHANLASVNTLAQAFNQAHPDIKVEPSMDVSADLFEIDAILEQYDCLAWFSYGYQGEIDQLYSLDPLLASEDPVFTDDFRSASLDVFRVGGELYALPAAIQPSVIYYNAEYLAKMGLAQPALDWTADDFVTLASLATSREGEDKVFGFVPFQGDANGFLLALQGGSLYDISSELRSVRFTDSNVISAATWRVDFANAGIMPSCTSACSSLGSDFRERERLVMSGHAAMWTNLAGGEGRLLGSGADFEVGVVPLPQLPVPILDSPFAYQGLYISRRAGDPRACWDWLKFLSEQPAAFNGVPARRSVAESEAWIAMVGSETSAAFQAALSRQMLNRPPGDVDWNALEPVTVWWGQAQTAVFRGEDPAVVLTEAQNKADIFLACLASANSRTPEQYDNCAKQADPQFGP
jgi:ABC-type glycerol-3-phosphate transport system substrate-binding protein